MKNKKFIKSILLIVIIIVSTDVLSYGQSNKESYNSSLAKVKSYDYLNHCYKYLDKDYRIQISSHTFDSLAQANNIIIDRIKEYKDSLGVVLCGEFNSWSEVNIAHHRLTMSWLRIGYILWLSESEAEKLGSKYNFEMPYELYEFFYKQPEKWDKEMIEFVSDYRHRIYFETNNEEVKSMSYKKIFNYALVENPVRKADYEELTKSQSGIGCNQPDCCQTPGNEKASCDN